MGPHVCVVLSESCLWVGSVDVNTQTRVGTGLGPGSVGAVGAGFTPQEFQQKSDPLSVLTEC